MPPSSYLLIRFIHILKHKKRKDKNQRWVTWTVFGWRQPWRWHKATQIPATSANQPSDLFTKTDLVSSPPEVCQISDRCPAWLFRTYPWVLRRMRGWAEPMILSGKWCTWTAGVKAKKLAWNSVEIVVVAGELTWIDWVESDDGELTRSDRKPCWFCLSDIVNCN
jgi:hypothetical protein